MQQIIYYSGGYVSAAPQQNRASLADLVAGTFTTWDASGVQTGSRPLTAAEVAALQAGDAATLADSNRGTLQQRAQNALTANANYLGIASPTNAQVVAQVQTLTKECSALIRLLLGLLDSTSGT